MGIETSLERVANALERIASTLEENTNVNDWYKGYLLKKDAAKGNANAEAALAEAHVDAAPEAAAPATDAPAAPEMSYDELKAFLIARGVEIPKGTKTTTLKKLYEKYKNTAPIDRVSPNGTTVPLPDAATVTVAPDDGKFEPVGPQDAPATAPEDPFFLPAAAPAPAPAKKPMTKDEAAEAIRAMYDGTPSDRQAFVDALAAVGVPEGGSFQDVPEGKFEDLVETYHRLRNTGAANA